ncbi:MAG: hypothetical protein ABIB97_04815 [Patescibacteria group bacterium]
MANSHGWDRTIRVYIGPMWAGKTEEKAFGKLRAVLRAIEHGAEVTGIFIKPSRDTRDEDPTRPKSHGGHELPEFPAQIIDAKNPSVMLTDEDVLAADVIVIDEGQFFDPDIARVILNLYHRYGKYIVFCALDTDHLGQPFPASAAVAMLPEARIYKIKATCIDCGRRATRSMRLIDGKPAPPDDHRFRVQTGEGGPAEDEPEVDYVPLCLEDFVKRQWDAGIDVL